jgi:phosphoglycerol transferase MdoB-like AlkP superfamily enzyme
MFSTGTRTNRGLSGTLLSFPPLPRNKTILRDAAADQSFSSLAELLKQRNYSTSFVYGGDLRFDNMQGFFRQQGFDTFFGEESFPDTAHRTVYGFADQYVYEKAFDYISNIEEPFFTTILTTSNHPPYTFPEYPEKGSIQYNSDLFKNERLEVFKYSDWALGEFIKNCKSSEFYNNTIFVFTGDHGFLTKGDPDASIDLQMYHVPCLIIAPRLDTQINSRTASHTDIQPTILDLLGGSYKHHSWGKNLLDKKRQDDFALLAPAGLNHIAGIVFEDVFYVHDFTGMHQVFTIESLENGIHLRVHKNGHPKLKDAKSHLFSVLKSASTALFNYTAGIPSK